MVPNRSPHSCSVLSAAAQESAYGTATPAKFWVALEQSGPWGRVAPLASRLDPRVGAAIDRAATAQGGRLTLIRSVGTHHYAQPRSSLAYLGFCGPNPWLLHVDLTDPTDLLRLDWTALGAGDRAAVLANLPPELTARPAEPILLVCTNGKRDVCCALAGRPVAAAAAAHAPGRVWECSHTGGHRFAPTGVLLPHGHLFARLTDESAGGVLAAADRGQVPAGLIGPRYDRGRSHLTSAQQAAVSAVRTHLAELGLDAFTAGPAIEEPASTKVTVTHRDGRVFAVALSRQHTGRYPASCQTEPVDVLAWTVAGIEEHFPPG